MSHTIGQFFGRRRNIALPALLVFAAWFSVQFLAAQSPSTPKAVAKPGPIKLGLVVYSGDAETVWNAFRLGVFALNKGDTVKVFLLAKGVDCESLDTNQFKVTDMMKSYVAAGGKIFACGTCLKIRQSSGSQLCPVSSMADLYEIIRESDRLLTF